MRASLLSHRLPPLLTVALAVALAAAPALAQQTGTIRGKVVAADTKRPLGDVQITLTNSALGARTSPSGEFQIANVPAGTHDLRAKRIGYAPGRRAVTVVAGEVANIELQLEDQPTSLDAVVVTGTAAETRKKELGNSMSTIGGDDITSAPVSNAQDILSARAPGVTVLANSGQPGAGGTIRLRGTNSLTQGNNPIVYVDGVRVYSENGPVALTSRQNSLAINDIKASDIERIEVVKGAAATTLYGTEASGGVIQIFTKRGVVGAPKWTADVTTGVNNMGHVGPDEDPTGLFVNKCRGDELVDFQGNKFVDPTCPASGSWVRNGLVQRYATSVSGGVQGLTYFISGTFNNEKGVLPVGGSKDGGFRGNFTVRPSPKVSLSLNSSYNKSHIDWVPDGNNASGFLLNVGRGPYNNYKGGKGECADVPATVTCVTNGYIFDLESVNRADHFITGFTVNWDPAASLQNRFSVGWDYNARDNQTVYPFGFLNFPRGMIWKQDWVHTKLSLDYAGSWVTKLPEQLASLNSTFSWGGQLFDDRENYMRVDGSDFSGPGDPTLGSAARASVVGVDRMRVVNAGVFLQEMVGWQDRLFITGGMRVDGNSAFGKNFGLQTYPKISAAYVISEHDWWPTGWAESLKLRAAIGEAGKAPGAFDATRTWDPIAGDEGKPGITIAQRGNPQLGPERTREAEVGFDAALLDGRIGLEFTGYRARTYGALVGVTYPPSEGFLRSQLENVGTLENSGYEVAIDAALVRTPQIDWRARTSLSVRRSEAIDIGNRPTIPTGLSSEVRKGYPIPSYFGNKITNPDAFADPVVEGNSFLGPVYPTRVFSLSSSTQLWERFTFDVLGEFQAGAYLANWVGYQNARRGVWYPCYETQQKLRAALGPDNRKGTPDDDPSKIADVTARERGRCAIDRTVMDDAFWITKTDFFKLRSVTLTYDVPQRFVLGGKSATVSLSGRNLWTSTEYDGTDPEVQDARDAGSSLGRRDYYNLPPYRTFLMSFRVTF